MTASVQLSRPGLTEGEFVKLNSGGPPMQIVERTIQPDADIIKLVAWWRNADGVPQIHEFDARCVTPVGRAAPAGETLAPSGWQFVLAGGRAGSSAPVPPGVPPDILDRLAAVVAKHSARLGLVVDPRPMIANEMRLPEDDRVVALDLKPPYWRDIPAQEDAIMLMAVELLEVFARRHGPGRVWTLGGLPLVHAVCDDGVRWCHDRDGGWVCRLRMLAAHEASARRHDLSRIAIVTAHRPAGGWTADVRPAPHPDGEVMHALWQEWSADLLTKAEVTAGALQHVESTGHEPTWFAALKAGTYRGEIPGQCDRCAR